MLDMFASERVHASAPLDTVALIRFSISNLCIIVVGIGLLYRRKWAAIYFSLATSGVGLFLIFFSILYIPFPWNLPNITLGVIVILPTIAIISTWSDLKWGGKWYL